MRILYHHRTQGEEPESIHISAIVQALRDLGHDVLVIGPPKAAHRAEITARPPLIARIKEAVPRPVFELMQLGYNALGYVRLRKAVRAYQPDLIYERYALYNFAGPLFARLHKIPLVLEVNTPYAQAWAQYYGLTLRRLARWIERRTMLWAHHVITVTEVQRGMLEREGIPSAHISVCHNAIDPDWFNPRRHVDPDLKARLGLREVVVGFVGTMNRWQGITEFPAVIAKVLTQCDNVSFLFVGDGEFRQQLETFCREQGYADRVVFTGRKPHREVPPLVAAMDIAVLLNSNNYGSPMKLFEYWGMGKAVIAPSVPPVVEVLKEGVTGIMIEPGNAAQMTDHIIRLAQDTTLRQRMGAAGREHVAAHHTWRDNAQTILRAHRLVVETLGQP
ncbi:glycosyltransferase family 4 protein [Aquabacterium sp.]|uniref:glycosyltransferase family 4 protein n=1 Tax=Aquabacterium sp. TaxID=1872578 RepID=UPI0035AE14BF